MHNWWIVDRQQFIHTIRHETIDSKRISRSCNCSVTYKTVQCILVSVMNTTKCVLPYSLIQSTTAPPLHVGHWDDRGPISLAGPGPPSTLRRLCHFGDKSFQACTSKPKNNIETCPLASCLIYSQALLEYIISFHFVVDRMGTFF